MPRIAKIKFKDTGEYVKNTRSNDGYSIELDIHYNADTDSFFFKKEDVKEVLNIDLKNNTWKVPEVFVDCKTKEDACQKMSKIINDEGEIEKWLRVSITMNVDHVKALGKKEEKKSLLKKTVRNYTYREGEGLLIDVKHYVSVRNHVGKMYFECDTHSEDKWKFSRYNKSHIRREGLIKWTQEREDFLMAMVDRLAEISKNVAVFFNIEEDEIDSLILNNSNLLENKS